MDPPKFFHTHARLGSKTGAEIRPLFGGRPTMYSKKVEYKNGTLFGLFLVPQSNCRVALVVFPPETSASGPIDTATEPTRHQFRIVVRTTPSSCKVNQKSPKRRMRETLQGSL